MQINEDFKRLNEQEGTLNFSGMLGPSSWTDSTNVSITDTSITATWTGCEDDNNYVSIELMPYSTFMGIPVLSQFAPCTDGTVTFDLPCDSISEDDLGAEYMFQFNMVELPSDCTPATCDFWGDAIQSAVSYYLTIEAEACPASVPGCMDPLASNYDSNATEDDGSCLYAVEGCTDETACNYNAEADTDDGSCEYADVECWDGSTVCSEEECPDQPVEECEDIEVTAPDFIDSQETTVEWVGGCPECGNIYISLIANGAYSSVESEAIIGDSLIDNTGTLTWTIPCDLIEVGETYMYFVAQVDCDLDDYAGTESMTDAGYGYSGEIEIAPEACPNYGCTDPEACNYDSTADVDDGSCTYADVECWDGSTVCSENECPPEPVPGCTDSTADNYNPSATDDDGSCIYSGCTDDAAANYDADATVDDGSCEYGGCTNFSADNYDPGATIDDGSCQFTIYTCESVVSDENELVGEECVVSNSNSPANSFNGEYADLESCEVDCGDKEVPDTPTYGCQDNLALNYNPLADLSDPDECIYECEEWINTIEFQDPSELIELTLVMCGAFCTEWNSLWSNPEDFDDDVTPEQLGGNPWCACCPIYGCTDETAINYQPYTTNYTYQVDIDSISSIYNGEWDLEGPPAGLVGSTYLNNIINSTECEYPVPGCTDGNATNFDDTATEDDGSCEYPPESEEFFCCDTNAPNYGYNMQGTQLNVDGYVDTYIMQGGGELCNDNICLISGCTDVYANNFNPDASYMWDDGSCLYTTTCYNCDTDLPYAVEVSFEDSGNYGGNDTPCEELGLPPNIVSSAELCPEKYGCTDPIAINYDPLATVDDGSCEYAPEVPHKCDPIQGCLPTPDTPVDPEAGVYASYDDCIKEGCEPTGCQYNVEQLFWEYPWPDTPGNIQSPEEFCARCGCLEPAENFAETGAQIMISSEDCTYENLGTSGNAWGNPMQITGDENGPTCDCCNWCEEIEAQDPNLWAGCDGKCRNWEVTLDQTDPCRPYCVCLGNYFGPDDPEDIEGCTDEAASNYNEEATIDDGSCEYEDEIQWAEGCEELYNSQGQPGILFYCSMWFTGLGESQEVENNNLVTIQPESYIFGELAATLQNGQCCPEEWMNEYTIYERRFNCAPTLDPEVDPCLEGIVYNSPGQEDAFAAAEFDTISECEDAGCVPEDNMCNNPDILDVFDQFGGQETFCAMTCPTEENPDLNANAPICIQCCPALDPPEDPTDDPDFNMFDDFDCEDIFTSQDQNFQDIVCGGCPDNMFGGCQNCCGVDMSEYGGSGETDCFWTGCMDAEPQGLIPITSATPGAPKVQDYPGGGNDPDYLRDKQQFIDRLVATGKYTHPDAQGEKKARSTTSPRPLRERFQKLAGIKKKKK